MALYTERVQTVITKRQYELLTQLAKQEQKPLSVLLREAVEQVYFTEIDRQRRRQSPIGSKWKRKLNEVWLNEQRFYIHSLNIGLAVGAGSQQRRGG